ncbi:hypothetical protein PENTCL1PPCAC_20209, partial [Pristionchus entomophagus]
SFALSSASSSNFLSVSESCVLRRSNTSFSRLSSSHSDRAVLRASSKASIFLCRVSAFCSSDTREANRASRSFVTLASRSFMPSNPSRNSARE